MGQLINFADLKTCDRIKMNFSQETDTTLLENKSLHDVVRDEYMLTLNILVHNHPGKECFSIKEASEKLGVGEEFIRRRIKSGKIKATYLGDKPIINIVELARIITEGV